jgi:hypothetical protein
MITWLTRFLTFALILCIGIMQLLLPFLHAHYNSNSVHVEGGVQLVHVHAIEFKVDSYGNAATKLSNHLETSVLSMDHILPNQNHLDDLEFIPFVILTLIFGNTFICFIKCWLTRQFRQHFILTWSLTRAPPLFS